MHTSPNAVPSPPIECWAGFPNGSTSFANFPSLDRIEANCEHRCEGFLIDGYVAFYIVEVDRIVIVRVVDGRRDIEREFSQ